MGDGPIYAVSVGGVILGLAVLLGATAVGVDPLIYGGGFVALASVGLLTYAVAAADGEVGHGDHDHDREGGHA